VIINTKTANPCLDLPGIKYAKSVSRADVNNMGIFVLYEAATGAVLRLEIFNLNDFLAVKGFPVYWLGRAETAESLAYLRPLANSDQGCNVAALAAIAMALHNDDQSAPPLKEIVRDSRSYKARLAAAYGLGFILPERGFLAAMVRDKSQPLE